MAGLLARLFGRTETRTAGYADSFGITATRSTEYVSPRLAENLATVTACVDAIAGTLAAQPAYVYRRVDAGRVEAPNHPVARLIRQPSAHQTWSDWIGTTLAGCLLAGNSLSIIEYDGAGRPTALVPVPWSNVQPMWLRSGRLAFDVQLVNPWGGPTERRRLLPGECFFLKDRSDDGVLGRSRISRSPGTIANAAALQDFTVSQWANQISPSGALEFPGPLSEEQVERVRKNLSQRHAGTANARSALLLPSGAKWVPMSVSPEDAEVLSSRKYGREEIATLFGVPAPVVGINDHSSFNNAETLLRFFAQSCLAGWARKVELEFARSVFGSSSGEYSIEISLDGLLRGDPAQRWAAHKIAVEAGILSPAEIREVEGWNPQPATPAPTVG